MSSSYIKSSESEEEIMKITSSKSKRVVKESDSSEQSDSLDYISDAEDHYSEGEEEEEEDDDYYTSESDFVSDEEIYGSKKKSKSKSKSKTSRRPRKRAKPAAKSGIVSDESESSDDEFDCESEEEEILKAKKRNSEFTGEVEFDERAEDRTVDMIGDWNEAKGEVLIKWKGRSWNWSTWLSFDAPEMQVSRRKLENFLKKVEEERADSEDGESVFLETLRFNLQENWRVVERIVAVKQTKERGSFYLCKWRALGYSDCTWEWEGDVRSFGAAELIDEFLARQYGPNSGRSAKRTASSFQKYTEAPEWLPSEMRLRDYQLEGVNWLLFSWFRRCNVILADEMGLGKTIQSVCFLTALKVDYGMAGPTLLVVPLSTIDAWQRELRLWARDKLNVVVYSGDAKSRQTARFYEFETGFDVLLTTYELVLKDQAQLSAIKWKLLLVDEGHRLKNSSSQLYDALFSLVPGSSGGRVLITGTPLQNSLGELWCLLRFLMPDKFADYEGFLERYSVDMSSNDGSCNGDPGGAANDRSNDGKLQELHALIKPHILRRLKRDVEDSLPGKSEKIIRVDLTALQKQLYRCILTRNYRDLKRTQEAAGNRAVGSLINILGELKKVCNHPVLLGTGSPALAEFRGNNSMISGWDESGKMVLLRRLLRRLKDDGHRVLVFSQSVKMLDLLEEMMKAEGYSWRRLDGSTTSVARHMAISAFNAPESQDFVFLLSTRAGGLGINLATADTVIIYDSDWNPQNDLQATARAHRIGQKRMVRIFRLVSAGTVEEEILERAKRKMVLDHLVIQQLKGKTSGNVAAKANEATTDLQAIIKFGAKSLFEADKPGIPASAVDLEAILREEPPTSAFDDHSSKAEPAEDEEFLGQFRIADLGTWDEIIPEGERLKIEEEERKAADLAKELELQEALFTAASSRRARKPVEAEKSTGKKGRSSHVNNPSKSSSLVLFPEGDEGVLKAFDSWSRFGITEKRGDEDLLMDRLEQLVDSGQEDSSVFQVIPGSPLQKTLISALLERVKGLKALQSLLSNYERLHDGDLKGFRLTLMGLKAPPSNWHIPSYSVLQDSALLVALRRFGYGSWQQIRDELTLLNAPGWAKLQSPQIVRRVDYLLKELQKTNVRVKEKEKEKKKEKNVRKIVPIMESSVVASTPLDEMRIIEKFRRPFKPVRESLVALESLKSESQSENIVGSVVAEHLVRLGDFIESDDGLKRDAEVWQFVGCFWPFQKASTGPELKSLYESLKNRN